MNPSTHVSSNGLTTPPHGPHTTFLPPTSPAPSTSSVAAATLCSPQRQAVSRYSGWSTEYTQWHSDLTTELLWHAHPRQVPMDEALAAAAAASYQVNPQHPANRYRHYEFQTLSLGTSEVDELLNCCAEETTCGGTQSTVLTNATNTTSCGGAVAGSSNAGPAGASAACDLDAELAGLETSVADFEQLRRLCAPLAIDTRCNLCAIISICLKQDCDQSWLLEYSLLCFKCSYAPRAALSTLIIMSEFTHLLQQHFSDLRIDDLFRHHVLTVFDFHLHFFINRCFEKQVGDAVDNENVTLNHLAVVRAMVMGEDTVPYNKPRRHPQQKQKNNPYHVEVPQELIDNFLEHSSPSRDRFVQLLFYMWAGTGVMSTTPLTELTHTKFARLDALSTASEREDARMMMEEEEDEEGGEKRGDDPGRHNGGGTSGGFSESTLKKNVGPIYLCPVPAFFTKNQTSTVCLLCELMACSYYDNVVLRELYRRVVSYCQNNVKMVDRIQLVLADLLRECTSPLGAAHEDVARCGLEAPTSPGGDSDYHGLSGVDGALARPDPVFCHVLRQAGVTGIYKHFFCDPQCAGNIRVTNEAVLFGRLHPHHVQEVKLAICHDNYYISRLPRRVWLCITLFKAFQITKRTYKGKVHLADFMRDFTQLLESCDIKLVDPTYVIDKYV